MYDRRVVRGNTFAALVIPVSKYTLLITQLGHQPNSLALFTRHAAGSNER